MNNQLIEDNINLVRGVLNRYYPSYKHDEDMFQIGCIGLCKAAQRWDSSRGEFSTIAYMLIRREINNELRKKSREPQLLSLDYSIGSSTEPSDSTLLDVVVGEKDVGYVDVDSIYSRLKPKDRKLIEMRQQGISVAEIAKRVGCSREHIYQIIRKLKRMVTIDSL